MLKLRRIIVFFVTFFLYLNSAISEDGPSYEETVKFILSKTQTKRSTDDYYYKFRLKEVNQCEFKHTVTQHYTVKKHYADIGKYSSNIYEFNLKYFDPSRVELRSISGVDLNARENKEVVDVTDIYYPASKVSYPNCLSWEDYKSDSEKCWSKENNRTSRVGINTYNFELNGPKLVKAFRHLIKLCGGKEELF